MDFFDVHLASASIDVSIVIPVHDEAPNLADLAREVESALKATRWSWECVWVDDGSTDGTGEQLARLSGADARHRPIELDANYGQSAALAAGFVHSRGAILVTLDGDGQNDPGDIPRVVARLIEGGFDVVNGYRAKSQFGLARRISSRIANRFRNALTGERVRDVGCSLRAFRRPCVEGIPVFKGMHRFLPTLMRLNGYDRILEMPVNHRPRRHGRSKYGISNRLWVGIADTMAIRWMSRRMVAPRLARSSEAAHREVSQ